jgi:hypothetical protein
VESIFREYRRLYLHRLKIAGVRRADAKIATMLATYIITLDQKVFGQNAPPVHYVTGTDTGVSVAYRQQDDKDSECYLVFASGLRRELDFSRRRMPLFVVTPQERAAIDRGHPPVPQWFQVFTAIAAHEVRHRMQFQHPELRQFVPGSSISRKSVIGTAWRICAQNWPRRCRAVVNSSLPDNVKTSQVLNEEFDAWVVETAALNILRFGYGLDMVAKIIACNAHEI